MNVHRNCQNTKFSSNNSVQPTELYDERRVKFYLDSYIGLMSHLIHALKVFPILI